MEYKYEETWGTPLGQDCVDLCTALPRWLGERLLFLGTHTISAPASYYSVSDDAEHALEAWTHDLKKYGAALSVVGNLSDFNLTVDEEDKARAAAEKALLWVAVNLGNLWD